MSSPGPAAPQAQVLKRDTFGEVRLEDGITVRDVRAARWWARPLARRLARREARALAAAAGIDGVPALLGWDGATLRRAWLPGAPMQLARPRDARWFRDAFRLLRVLHRRGIAHNDLAKEPNWLVLADDRPGLVDFQLSRVYPRRGRWFRLCAREDLRHLLKHKRTYRPEALTPRQRTILATPAWPSRLWRVTGKRVYRWVTRRVFGWADREGATDRGSRIR